MKLRFIPRRRDQAALAPVVFFFLFDELRSYWVCSCNSSTPLGRPRVCGFMGHEETHLRMYRRHVGARIAKTFRTKAWVVALSALVLAGSASACSGVGPPGRPVVFGDQTNIIIWDEAHHTEHFIRNANFRSGADNFGFIAPTPGKPKLNQASNQAFYTLANLAPVVRFGAGRGGAGGASFKSRADEVQVIQEADVA